MGHRSSLVTFRPVRMAERPTTASRRLRYLRSFAVIWHLAHDVLFQPLHKEGMAMLWTVAVVLLVLWALGLVTSYTMGGFIHALLIVAVVVVLVRVIGGGRLTS